MKNLLIPRSNKKSTASLSIRAACAMSIPNVKNMSEREVEQLVNVQEARLSAIAADKRNTAFSKQEGRTVIII